MTPIVAMAAVSVAAWAVVSTLGGERVNPETMYGMLGPLASACATWVVVQRTYRVAPERVTAVMVTGFAVKLVFFGAYVAVMLRVLALRPEPFVVAFVSYFIALYAMQALFLKRLMTIGPSEAGRLS
jgi:hypothetical protein